MGIFYRDGVSADSGPDSRVSSCGSSSLVVLSHQCLFLRKYN